MAGTEPRDLHLDYAAWLDPLSRDERKLVAVERRDATCAVVRMDDPANHNALSGALTLQLQQALAQLCAETRLRTIVLPEHVPAMTKPLLRAACDASFEQMLLAEEYAEPNTFTTHAHQETVRTLLAKQEKA